jgi:hypothetical protein
MADPKSYEYANQLQDQYRHEFTERQARKNKRASARARATAPPTPPVTASAPLERDEDIEIDLSSSYRNNNHRNPAPSAPPVYTSTINSTMTPNMDDDEAYARQLQNEMELEHQQQQQQQQQQRSEQSPFGVASTSSTTTLPLLMDKDARMAQQLQDEELARRYSQQSGFLDELSSSNGTMASSHRNSHGHTSHRTSTEEEPNAAAAARRIAQEMDDAEMAQRLSVYEQEASSRLAVQQQRQQQQQGAGPSSGLKLIVGRVLPLLICGVAISIAVLFLLGVFQTDNVPFLGNIFPGVGDDDWIDTDPWSGNGVGPSGPISDSNDFSWSNKGNGIRLEILNALDDSWQSTLQVAVANWDAGYPIDSLTLSITQVAYEMDCKAVQSKLKVCNADYGPTRWRGLNEVLLNRRTNTIISSSAKMNEHYLRNEGGDQKLYTMCHELGHGFGLPHWDEDFYNKDLGNCMDYTNNFDANKHPDETNYEFLLDLYGATELRRQRHLKKRIRERSFPKLPETIRRTMREAVSKLEQRIDDMAHEDGWRLLHRTKHGEAHEMELGEGYKVRVHMLLA